MNSYPRNWLHLILPAHLPLYLKENPVITSLVQKEKSKYSSAKFKFKHRTSEPVFKGIKRQCWPSPVTTTQNF